MKLKTLQTGLLGVVTCALLTSCGGSPSTPGADGGPSSRSPEGSVAQAPSDPAPSQAAPSTSAPSEEAPSKGASSKSSPSKGADPEVTTGSADPTEDSEPTSGDAPSPDDGGVDAPQAEMPPSPEPTVTSLSELLPEQNTSPLVTAPLPRAASVRGRLVRGFPSALRPARRSAVESSSVSPSGDRLQVALVASTSLKPDRVLLTYRLRLARRGMVEQTAPAAAPGSRAAAFRRGRSVVTVTVTDDGPRTRYFVTASLHTGGT